MRIVERLREAAGLFREHPVYNSEGDSVLLTVNAALDDEAAALLEQAEAALEDARRVIRQSSYETPATMRQRRKPALAKIDALLSKLREGGE